MKQLLITLFKELESLPKLFVFGLGVLLVVIIGTIDYLIRVDMSLSIVYFIPIILVAWFVSRSSGIVISLLSSFSWFFADLVANKYPYTWLIVWNTGVRLVIFLLITYLLSELKEAYEREKKLARTDGLTGAINRRFFRQLLQAEIDRSGRYKHPLTLAYFDVDNFKQVNDNLGHSTGDYLLKLITEIIKKSIRQTDTLARLGGDEFALILLETDYEAAQIVLNRIQQELFVMIELEQLPISFSIGAITYRTSPESVDRAIEQVDNLMYDVKNNGKNGLKHQTLN
ncbi:diguanylate cyclase [Crocosphaera sp. XPORK-15E]|uniref:GGDEF domain-containing protein n=1 Tax=Crocosphaera sp. XPORK-15E TaxID=3110247 RepID=UPI002B2003E3|nr:diguanylate cyclase [Crocosphaera sp. XPORK-15E]MEA5537284.1 diguanylate cyclase [Crocosphaera sp. XPORK-15E]